MAGSSDQKHVAVCSYSPVSDGAAFVELIKNKAFHWLVSFLVFLFLTIVIP